jgi:ABC-type multidrug transport system permease subunit
VARGQFGKKTELDRGMSVRHTVTERHGLKCGRKVAVAIIASIIIIIIISFMQGIYTYIPETNHVPKQYNVAAILSLLFMALILLVSALLFSFLLLCPCRLYNRYLQCLA